MPMDSHEDYVSKLSEHYRRKALEGQLSVDVLETPEEIVIRSAIAGVTKDDLDITVTADTLTIRGHRSFSDIYEGATVHIDECYWGDFSRSVVLPSKINPDETEATLKDGILTIRLKKAEMASHIPLKDA